MKNLVLFVLAVINFGLTQGQINFTQGQIIFPQGQSNTSGHSIENKTDMFHLSAAMTGFASRLYNELIQMEDGNIIFSPFSIHTAMAMTYYGSPTNSETSQELAKLLGLSAEFHQAYPQNYLQSINRYDDLTRQLVAKIQIANKIYTNKAFNPKQGFVDLLQHFFKTSQEPLDFADNYRSADTINSFVSNKTGGLISNLISPDIISNLTRMILINAIYFKADWKTKFDPLDTYPGQFSINGESFTHDAMMYIKGEFGIAEFPTFKVLELPYKSDGEDEDNYIRMLIILPNEDVGIERMDSAVKTLNWTDIDQEMRDGPATINVPKFKIDAKSELVPKFQHLGVKTLFDSDKADLSNITDVKRVAVQDIVHKAVLEVNEEGSEAAAATSGQVIEVRTIDKSMRYFIVDRPFIFMIQDKALGVPLFMGRVVDPSGVRRLKKHQQ